MASVGDAGFDEVSVHAALLPTPRAWDFIRLSNAGFIAGEAFAAGWLERRLGRWLQASPGLFRCRREVLGILSEATIEPNGFASHGRLII